MNNTPTPPTGYFQIATYADRQAHKCKRPGDLWYDPLAKVWQEISYDAMHPNFLPNVAYARMSLDPTITLATISPPIK